jgi:aminomethyltransferase
MPQPTPFHPRTAELCTSLLYKEWAGYYAVRSYDVCHSREYFAFRHAAGLLDVTPLFKYAVRGKDAAAFLARVWAKDVSRLAVGRVTYGCWCDDDGKVLDDGTLTRLDERAYRMTSADPSRAWLERNAAGFEVEIEDQSHSLAALALQGPNSCGVLSRACGEDLTGLRFFHHRRARIAGADVEVTRTGYTGDLGYEVWIPNAGALAVYDALLAAGAPLGLEPAGLDALDVTRIEAGFILMGVDYKSARRCLAEGQKSSPYEIGLGWAVELDRDPFVGQAALRREAARGPRWQVRGVEIDWRELEELYDRAGLPTELPLAAYRSSIPIYRDSQQVGYATSGAWSPTLKRNLALATLGSEAAVAGTRLSIEQTVEYQRHRVTCTVADTPFFDPERKRATPAAVPARA